MAGNETLLGLSKPEFEGFAVEPKSQLTIDPPGINPSPSKEKELLFKHCGLGLENVGLSSVYNENETVFVSAHAVAGLAIKETV